MKKTLLVVSIVLASCSADSDSGSGSSSEAHSVTTVEKCTSECTKTNACPAPLFPEADCSAACNTDSSNMNRIGCAAQWESLTSCLYTVEDACDEVNNNVGCGSGALQDCVTAYCSQNPSDTVCS